MREPAYQRDGVAIKAPFPYFGGKSLVAEMVWQRLGDVPNYVEPFAGSLAVLLGRPHWPFEKNRIETVNDADCFLANFWRALQADPDAVAEYCDWPVNEADLHARHFWLVNVGREHVGRLRTDPDYYDAKIAGWWVWGICQWIGAGWCHHHEWQQRPHLGDAGRGVHRPTQKRPHLGNAGRGVHRPTQKRPHLGDAGRGDLHEYLALLATRLRRVRVCCGDWSRVCGRTPTFKLGLTGVFLDPPYTTKANRKSDLYSNDDLDVGHAVRDWAVEQGGNKRMRIALCGYEGEYEMPGDWDCYAWKARGGYASRGSVGCNGRANAAKERIWFSPHCLSPTARGETPLFSGLTE